MPNLVQVTESISGSVVPLAMFVSLFASILQVEGHTVTMFLPTAASHSGYFQFCVAVNFLQIINPPVLKRQFSEESQYPTSGLDKGKRSNYIKVLQENSEDHGNRKISQEIVDFVLC